MRQPPQGGQCDESPGGRPLCLVCLLPNCLTLSLGGTFRNATLATFGTAIWPASSIVAAVALICLLYSTGKLHPLVMTEVQELAPPKRRCLLLGFLNTLVFLWVAISSAVFGWLAQKAGGPPLTFQIILFVTAGCLLIGLTAYLTRAT
jgi:MFS family permease